MGQIHLLRHGQANLLGDDYDRLSDLGHEQGRVSGITLAERGVRPVVVASGQLRRQADTASAAVEGAGWSVPVSIDPDFDEYRHEDLFTTLHRHLPDHAAIAAFVARAENPRRAYQDLFESAFTAWVGGATGISGVTWVSFRDRCLAAIQRIVATCGRGENAVVVTSGGVIAAITQSLLGVPDTHVLKLHNPLHNASITRLLTNGRSVSSVDSTTYRICRRSMAGVSSPIAEPAGAHQRTNASRWRAT